MLVNAALASATLCFRMGTRQGMVFLPCLHIWPFSSAVHLLRIARTLHPTTGRVWFSSGTRLTWRDQNLEQNSLTKTSSRRPNHLLRLDSR